MRQTVQIFPEGASYLEVVALMTHHIKKRLVASELKIFAGRVGTERFVGLAMGVPPIMHKLGVGRDDPQRIRTAEFVAAPIKDSNDEIAGLCDF
jgi:hypothetical protein